MSNNKFLIEKKIKFKALLIFQYFKNYYKFYKSFNQIKIANAHIFYSLPSLSKQ